MKVGPVEIRCFTLVTFHPGAVITSHRESQRTQRGLDIAGFQAGHHFRTGSCATASNPMIMFASVLLDVFSTGQRRRFISETNFRGSRDYANQLKKFTLRASNRSERKFQLRIDEVLILVYVFVSARSCRNTVRCLNDDTNRGGKRSQRYLKWSVEIGTTESAKR